MNRLNLRFCFQFCTEDLKSEFLNSLNLTIVIIIVSSLNG